MGWKTDVQSVVWDVTDKVKNTADSFIDLINGKIGSFKAEIGSLVSGTSYIGINGSKITTMRDAINSYVVAIQKHLDEVMDNTETSGAFKGEYAAAVKEYVSAIKKVCKDYTSTLLEFSDNLDQIAALYHEKDTTFASNISSTANEASSNSTEYTEQRGRQNYGTSASGN